MSSIVLDNSLEALFSLINAVDESLPATPIWNNWPAEKRSVDWVYQTLIFFINNSTDEWKQRLQAVIKDSGAHKHLFK